ncbi:Epsin-3, clathrin recruitment and traffic between the Golgi and endosome [Yamadazyma tenuis]|uniref:ENTH domain-containing protein n=1 Tax=Candida tenuis (strain ATCC 10573 / BCRC 21748 / CBS 615 / JCM 9827 / NBRC 10315 / NRRL Y-1498 / VKM Y-70) TaxID=590646 RepID=G3B538_CANTC|nr:uncharacterized protein CANTEDRAFT_130652 [Yamadazyma tenuis ATCC 10573]EGV63129.1 hypothetical protein CANTEDRAFT_130652 [Yamadazyma tenuis ATCC 10573]WEJ97055.1 Epsin-3, clathrin recruitment and traffic between the Golgi and endosome [Yamadazyma tenuis]
MDLLKDATKNMNLYGVKAYVRKAQNVAMNLTEMESKVREATNNEPWGASSTLMAQIAAGTYNYRERGEIIAFVFRRFTEKAPNEWRQIYKSLQLLDYLLRNGSERVVDEVRASLSLIQMLLGGFRYIDSQGRDQGINVRNSAKKLITFVNDDAAVRAERKKAKSNAKKFGGVSSAAFGGASSITTTPGFDDDYTNRVFGDGGVYGSRYGDSADEYNNQRPQGEESGSNTESNDNFEEYEVNPSSRKTAKPTTGSSAHTATSNRSKPQPAEPDLLADLDFGSAPGAGAGAEDEDEFDDFQSAPTTTGSSSQPPSGLSNLNNLYQSSQPNNFYQPQPQQAYQQPQQYQQPQTSVNYNINSGGTPTVNKVQSKPNNDAFSSLFSSAKTKSTSRTPSGTAASKPVSQPAKTNDDDFFGDFNSNNNSNSKPQTNGNGGGSNGEVDLLSF